MHKFRDSKFNKQVVSIGPGEFYITEEDLIIQTVLGSCIAVCLYSETSPTVGMNHFMLPGKITKSHLIENDAGRYGMFSMELLINSILKEGIKKKDLKAKVFGGGNVIEFKDPAASRIGDNNVLFIKEYLDIENIPVISSHVGGVNARKILFFSHTKDVLLKKIDSSARDKTVEEEIKYKSELSRESEKSNIILFE